MVLVQFTLVQDGWSVEFAGAAMWKSEIEITNREMLSDHHPATLTTTPAATTVMSDLDVYYVPGKKLYIADTLNRACIPQDALSSDLDHALKGQVLAIDNCFRGYQRILTKLKKLQQLTVLVKVFEEL